MLAAWWWIDRWRKSTGYTGLSLEAQAAYRNLLDELWLRDGLLPDDDRVLGNICGDARRWDEVKPAVLAHFTRTVEGWRHPTHDEVAAESQRRRDKQAAYRLRVGNTSGNGIGNTSGNKRPSPSPSPSPSPYTVSDSKIKVVSSASAKGPTHEPPAVLIFPVTGKGPSTWGLTESLVAEWTAAFPALDVLAESRKALVWIQANRRKTARGMPRFLVAWLNRATNTDVTTRNPTGADVRQPGTWIGGYRVEDMIRTPEEVAADDEKEKARARYR
jgi:uncharacterized protein YdaU (DUF1376 family)